MKLVLSLLMITKVVGNVNIFGSIRTNFGNHSPPQNKHNEMEETMTKEEWLKKEQKGVPSFVLRDVHEAHDTTNAGIYIAPFKENNHEDEEEHVAATHPKHHLDKAWEYVQHSQLSPNDDGGDYVPIVNRNYKSLGKQEFQNALNENPNLVMKVLDEVMTTKKTTETFNL